MGASRLMGIVALVPVLALVLASTADAATAKPGGRCSKKGTVCSRPQLYSSDYSIRVAPTGVACSNGAAPILIEHEHLLNPTVNVGEKVRAGQQIGVVSDDNPNWKAKGMGVIETGVECRAQRSVPLQRRGPEPGGVPHPGRHHGRPVGPEAVAAGREESPRSRGRMGE